MTSFMSQWGEVGQKPTCYTHSLNIIKKKYLYLCQHIGFNTYTKFIGMIIETMMASTPFVLEKGRH